LGFGCINGIEWVHLVREYSVDVFAEVVVVNKVSCAFDSVLLYQLLNFFFCEPKSECSETGSEGSLSNMAFSESVEVNEELFDSDSISCNLRSKSFLNIKLNVEHWVSLWVDARVG